MRAHPAYWNEASADMLLGEVVDLEVGMPPSMDWEHVQHIKTGLLAPLVEILETQQETINEYRHLAAEKDEQSAMALHKLQDDYNKALQQLTEESERVGRQNKFCDTLLQDLDEMAKILDQSRQKARKAEVQLAEREREIKNLLQEKQDIVNQLISEQAQLAEAERETRCLLQEKQELLIQQISGDAEREREIERLHHEKQELLIHLISGGPSGFVEWAKKEIEAQGLHVGEALDRVWQGSTVRKDMMDRSTIVSQCETNVQERPPGLVPTVSQDRLAKSTVDTQCQTNVKGKPLKRENPSSENLNAVSEEFKQSVLARRLGHITSPAGSSKEKLLWLIVSDVFQEGVISFNRVIDNGPSSLPSAVIGFWLGLAGRMVTHASETLLSPLDFLCQIM